MKAALYIRVSTEDQAEHGYSLADQEDVCRNKASELGATESVLFADEGVSGALLERPGLTALRDAVRTGAFSYVIAKDPDRLSRELSHQLLLTQELERHSRLVFAQFERSTSPEGQMFYHMRGVIAQYEKEKITERMMAGRKRKAKEGKMPTGFKPYGYTYNKETASLTINEEQAAVVRRIFSMLVDHGRGPTSIARRLNAEGVPSRQGGKWGNSAVRYILLNPVYTGTFWANRYHSRGAYLNPYKADKSPITVRPREEWIPIEVPAIIDQATFQRAQDTMENARRLWAGRPTEKFLLSGLLRCGKCGQTMYGSTLKRPNYRYRRYSCQHSLMDSEKRCGKSHGADDVEGAVWSALWSLMDKDALPDGSGTVARREEEMAEIDRLLAQQDSARARLLDALESGVVTKADVRERLDRIAARTSELQRHRRTVEADTGKAQAWENIVAHMREVAEGVDKDAMTFTDKQAVIRSLVREVVVYPDGKVSIALRGSGFSDGDLERRRISSTQNQLWLRTDFRKRYKVSRDSAADGT